MTSNFESKIKDPSARLVFQALADPAWDFRTIEGISRSTGITEPEVKSILREHRDLVRQSPVPDRQGRQLYTLRTRSQKAQELISEIRSFVTKSIS